METIIAVARHRRQRVSTATSSQTALHEPFPADLASFKDVDGFGEVPGSRSSGEDVWVLNSALAPLAGAPSLLRC
jgi:hypothetical protein